MNSFVNALPALIKIITIAAIFVLLWYGRLDKFTDKLAKLIDVKSLIFLAMTAAMIWLLFSNAQVPDPLLMLFSSSYGAMAAYYFNRKDKDTSGEISGEIK